MKILNLKKVRDMRRQKQRQELLREQFDADYYLSQFGATETRSIVDPFSHFLLNWHLNGFDPNPLFSMSAYLEANPDVAESKLNPLVHYVTTGLFEGRKLAPNSASSTIRDGEDNRTFREPVELPDTERLTLKAYELLNEYLKSLGFCSKSALDRVDRLYYTRQFTQHNEGFGRDLDVDEHYDQFGWSEGFNPTPWFNTKFYLREYPDVAQSGVNPFKHFVNQGFLEKRLPSRRKSLCFESVLEGQEIRKSSQNWTSTQLLKIRHSDNAVRGLRSFLSKEEWVLSLGHVNYLQNVGGIQTYTYVESQKYKKLGFDYVHISPSRPLPVLADASLRDIPVKVVINNHSLEGDFLFTNILEQILSIKTGLNPERVVLNSIYGWSTEILANKFSSLKLNNFFWIVHDYSTFCVNPTLSFENVSNCFNPETNSGLCLTCMYGRERSQHNKRVNGFLAKFPWTFVAPSTIARNRFADYMGVDAEDVKVVPHGVLKLTKVLRTFNTKPRIAFVGYPSTHKGWNAFKECVFSTLSDIDFYHFGEIDAQVPGVQFVELKTNFSNLNLARDLLVDYEIDAVFILPTWEETFSFVTYEALAASCEIITSPGTGNVFDASLGRQILVDLDSADPFSDLVSRILVARNKTRMMSEFTFTGTSASIGL